MLLARVFYHPWTLPYGAGKRLGGKPVFVLASKRTFSGAEGFSYDLKNLKRAALLERPREAARTRLIGVPFAQALYPISKMNEEGSPKSY